MITINKPILGTDYPISITVKDLLLYFDKHKGNHIEFIKKSITKLKDTDNEIIELELNNIKKIICKKNAEELLNEYNKLKTDVDRWKWVRDNQDTGIVVKLDKDLTYGVIKDENKSYSYYIFDFEGHIGHGKGAYSLLESLGIKVELV